MSKLQKKSGKSKKYLALILMIIALCTIYVIPYLRYTYFTPLQQAMGLENNATKFGNLISIYGIMNLICYLPGGIIADKFDAKKLLVFSMIATGALGIWMGTWPSYQILVLIHVLLGITTVLTFWSSSVKCVNMLAAADEQGQMFGFLEGGRGLFGLGISAVFLAGFAYFSAKAGDIAGITFVVMSVSVVMIFVGIALAFLLPKTDNTTATNSNLLDSLKAMGKSFTLPITWALAGLIFTCSVMAASASYFAPYLQGACGLTAVAASTFAMLRANATAIIAAPVAGVVSKKMGRSSFVMIIACAALVILNMALRFTPATSAVLWFLMIIMILFTFCYSANRAVYWAIIDESGTPKNMVGSVIGVASLIGFLPDTFINTVYGGFVDKYDLPTAYGKIFMFCIICSVVGLLLSILAERVVKKHQAKQKTIQQENPASI